MPVYIGQAELSFEDPEADWNSKLRAVGLMIACHRRIERFIAVLVDLAMRVHWSALTKTESGALETALRYFRDVAPHHTADEESGLFPNLEQPYGGSISYLSDLERDHRRAERLHCTVHRLGLIWRRQVTLDDSNVAKVQSALADLSTLYREHIRIEEQQVFPCARTALSRGVLKRIGGDMASRRGVAYIPPTVRTIATAQMETP